MRKSIYTLGALVSITFVSCQNLWATDRATEAYAQAPQADVKQSVNPEYPIFRRNAEQQINDNDKTIANLRAKPILPGNETQDAMRKQKIDNLERKNAGLRSKLNNYEKQPGNWEAFKLDFNHEKDNLHGALHDFGKDMKQ